MKNIECTSKWLALCCLPIVFGFLFCGCSFGPGNGYVKFFESSIPQEQVDRLLDSDEYPREIKEINLVNGQEMDNLLNEYGYIYIGSSGFQGVLHTNNNPREAASRIGANVYIKAVSYSHTVNGTYTIMMPTTSRTRTNSNASAYGSGGWASGSGNSTSTTYSSAPITRSYSIDKYNQSAAFFLCD